MSLPLLSYFLIVCGISYFFFLHPIVYGIIRPKKSKGHVNKNGDCFPEEKIEETTNNTVIDAIQNSNWKTFGDSPAYRDVLSQSFANQVRNQQNFNESIAFWTRMIDVSNATPAVSIETAKQEEKPTVTKEQLTERLVMAKRKIQLDDSDE